MKLMVIAGIRSQLVKMAAFQFEMQKYFLNNPNPFSQIVYLYSGQHYSTNLSSVFINELNIQIDWKIEHVAKSPEHIFSDMIKGIGDALDHYQFTKNDFVIVFGDGNPTLSGALAAARRNIRVAHIEAGMERNPIEKEYINRKITDQLSDLYLCVSKYAIHTLESECITENVYWTGDLAYNYFMTIAEQIKSREDLSNYILVTLYRPHNITDRNILNIVTALNKIDVSKIFICHPRLKNVLVDTLAQMKEKLQNTNLALDPLSYTEMISTIKGSQIIITDAGGVIREAYHLNKRCIVIREKGGWAELIDIGYNLRTSFDINDLSSKIQNLLVKNFYDTSSNILVSKLNTT